MANALAFSAFVPFLALWLTGPVGMSATVAGISGFAVYSLTAMAGGLLGGRLSDRIGSRPTMLLGLGAGTFRLGALALTEDPITVTALIAFGGLVDSVVQPASQALVAERVPATRMNEAYGAVRGARTLGFGLGPVAGAALVPVSFSAVLLAAAACRAAAFVAALFVREPAPAAADSMDGSAGSLLRDLPFMGILAATGLLALFYGWYETVVPVHLEARGIAVSTWGAIYAGGALFTALLAVYIARFIDRLPRFRRWVAVGALTYGAAFVLLLPGVLATVLPGVALVALAQMVLNPIENTLTARLAPTGRSGAYQGALSFVHSIAFATGPALGLVLYDETSAAMTFLLAAALLPLGGVVLTSAIGAAAALGRLRLTPVTRPRRVTAVTSSPMSFEQGRWTRVAEEQLDRARRRHTRMLAAQAKRTVGVGAALAFIGLLGVIGVIVCQLAGVSLETDQYIAALTAFTVVVVGGCVYEYVSERTRRQLIDAQLKRLGQEEQEAVKQLREAAWS